MEICMILNEKLMFPSNKNYNFEYYISLNLFGVFFIEIDIFNEKDILCKEDIFVKEWIF